MVEIMAVIRPNRTSATKDALIEVGYPGYTCHKAVGRGKKPVNIKLADGSTIRTSLVTKRVLSIVVPDSAEEKVVNAIMEANCTDNPGDGKIFVSHIEKSYSVHTKKYETD